MEGEFATIWMKGTATEIIANVSRNVDHYGVSGQSNAQSKQGKQRFESQDF